MLFNLVFSMEVFLLTKNLLTLLIVIPIHGICALLCLRDARYFDLVLETASGRKTKSEAFGYGDYEFAPWIVGATM